MTAVAPPAPSASSGGPVTIRGRIDAPLIGFLAFAIGVVAIGRPSLWVDEAATVSASTRPVTELWAVLQHVDAVHGLYYLLMHGWSLLTPSGAMWLRLPSALLVGVAAAGVVVLGRQLSGRAVSVAAGVVFALLPRTTWAATEARPYALTMACAVWLTVLLVVAVRRHRTPIWIAYGLALAASVIANIMVLLVLAAHAVLVIWAAPQRRVVIAWVATAAAAVAAVVPLVFTLSQQQAQVSWIWPISAATAGQVFAEQYFPSVYSDGLRAVGPDQRQFTSEQLWVAMQAWALVVPLISLVIVIAALAVRQHRRGMTGAPPGSRLLVAVSAGWVLLPTVVLVGYSALLTPIYQPQYLTFTTPGAALLIGLCVVMVGRDGRRIGAILALIGVAALPNYLAQRSAFAKYGSDYSQVADVLAAHAAPGDCLMVDEALGASAAHGIEGARPGRGPQVVDIGIESTALQDDSLFGSRLPVDIARDGLRACAVVWIVSDRDPREHGFRLVQQWQFNQVQVFEMTRAG